MPDPDRPRLCERCQRRPVRFALTVLRCDTPRHLEREVKRYWLCSQCVDDGLDALDSLVSQEAKIQGD